MLNRETEMRNQKSGIRKKWFFLFLFSLSSFLFSVSFAQDSLKESLSELNRILPLKKAVNAPWGRDPFAPLVGGDFTGLADLRLTAIIYSEKRPSAIINGKIVYIGDSIDGQKVIDITKQYVILHGRGGSYKLEIGNPVGQGYDIRKAQ